MNKYTRVKAELASGKEGSMRVFGKSMEPIIYTGSLLTYKVFLEYHVDDVVFSKVGGRNIDAHKVIEVRDVESKSGIVKEYLIANNHGYVNGWTRTIYGKVIKIEGK